MSESETPLPYIQPSVESGTETRRNLALLKSLSLFAPLPDSDLLALADAAHLRSYDPNDSENGVIFAEGDVADSVLLVVSGRVAIHVSNTGGTRILVQTVEEGGFFGEVAMLGDGCRSASARALSPTVLLQVCRDDLLPILRAHPDIMLAMFRETAHRLSMTSLNLRKTSVRNPNDLIQEKITPAEQNIHRIARFCGSPAFIYWAGILLVAWIGTATATGLRPLDGIRFNALALVVAIVSIAVSCIVLHSQSLQADRDRHRNNAVTEVNLKSEAEILRLHEKLDDLDAEIRRRIP